MNKLTSNWEPFASMSPYDQYSSELFDLIDDIEQTGMLENILEIPNVVATGDQTSGKSSVLGKLSGVQLPSGDGAVTKCAVQLAMRKSSSVACMMTHPEHRQIADVNQIKQVIDETQNKLSIEFGFNCQTMPKFRIENPNAKNLTIVDLPGIFHASSRSQDGKLINMVEDMVNEYIKNPKCLLLCVIDATKDLALNKIFNLLKTCDKDGFRTIVVFTKIDKCLQDRSRLEKFLNEIKVQDYHTFQHHAFVNCIAESNEEEEEFFRQVCRDFKIRPENCTIANLYRKVCEMILTPILKEFKRSWGDVEMHLTNVIEEKKKLDYFHGDSKDVANRKLAEFIEKSRNFLQGHAVQFKTRPELNMNYKQYREFFNEFKQEYRAKMDKTTREIDWHVVTESWRRQETVEFSNWGNYKSYAAQIVTLFATPAEKCVERVRSFNKEAVTEIILDTFEDQEEHIQFLTQQVSRIFDEQERSLRDRLDLVRRCESFFYSDDELYERYRKTEEELDEVKQMEQRRKTRTNAHGVVNQDDDGDEQESTPSQDSKSNFLESPATAFQSEHIAKKKNVYQTALSSAKKIAFDRLSNVVPAQILLSLNEEVQTKIQQIDRLHEEFCCLDWKMSSQQELLQKYEETEFKIREWRSRYQQIERCIQGGKGAR